MRLSEHFDSWEFACRCGCGQMQVDPRLVAALEALRGALGLPIRINSAYRCKAHNKAVGGVTESQHTRGRAADITVEGMAPEEVAAAAEKIEGFSYGGIGRYKTFTHVDVRTSGKARWRG